MTLHTLLGNFYLQIQEFLKAIEFYQKAFNFVIEEIQQK